MNELNCVLCDIPIGSDKFSLQENTTLKSYTVLLHYLEYVLGEQLLVSNYNICLSCFRLLNELEEAELRAQAIKTQLCEFYQNYKKKCENKLLEVVSELPLDDIQNVSNCKIEQDVVEHMGSKNNGKYKCLVCHKEFVHNSSVENHMKKQHREEYRIFNENCENENIRAGSKPFLDAQAHNPDNLELHVQSVNTEFEKNENKIDVEDLKILKSEILENKSEMKVKKKKGQSKQNFDLPKIYQCAECPKKWKTLSELKMHTSAHSKTKPFICEICGQAYKHKGALDVHVGMHNGINPHTCTYCKKAFTQKGGLMRHLPIHTGEMHHQCDLCGRRFVHHTSFNIHRLSHTGEKAYKCQRCGLALMSASHLKRHMRVHTGEKNYSCNLCGKRFAERYNLASHEKLHSSSNISAPKRKYRCQICPNSFDRKVGLEEHLAAEHHESVANLISISNTKLDGLNIVDGQHNNYNAEFQKEYINTKMIKADPVLEVTPHFMESLQLENDYLKSLHIYTDNAL